MRLLGGASSLSFAAAHRCNVTLMKRELSVAGVKCDIPQIEDFLEHACKDAGVDPSASFDLHLALEEACCNVIEHAYEGQGGELNVGFETVGRDVILTVHDHGHAFDPDTIAAPDLSVPLVDRPIGGLGLHIMGQVMDDLRFSFSDTGNTLVMLKRDALPASPTLGE
jgi:serine/threonine-protein kinase RsbW